MLKFNDLYICGSGLPSLCLADWMEIKTNYMIVVTAKMNVLLIPIVDKFYVSPSDPAAESRGIDLAVAKGFYSHPKQLQQT
jgi:glutamine amidotransferase